MWRKDKKTLCMVNRLGLKYTCSGKRDHPEWFERGISCVSGKGGKTSLSRPLNALIKELIVRVFNGF